MWTSDSVMIFINCQLSFVVASLLSGGRWHYGQVKNQKRQAVLVSKGDRRMAVFTVLMWSWIGVLYIVPITVPVWFLVHHTCSLCLMLVGYVCTFLNTWLPLVYACMYVCNWWLDLDEHIHSWINQSIATDCKTFWPCMPSSTAFKTVDEYCIQKFCTQLTKAYVAKTSSNQLLLID